MPNLKHLSLEEVKKLSMVMLSLRTAGTALVDQGINPVFDLTPGQSPMIHLAGYVMPHAYTADESEFNAARDDFARELPKMQDDLIQKVQKFTATTYPHWPVYGTEPIVEIEVSPAAPPPAADEVAPDQPEQTAASPAGAETRAEGGGGAQAAPAPAASHNPQTGPVWSEEENAQLVQLVVEGIMAGKSKRAATMAAADVLGRPHEGTAFRLRTKAAAAFETALQAAVQAAGSNAFEAAEKTEILGGDPGGLQRDQLAEKAPASPAAQQRAQADVQAQAAAGDLAAEMTHAHKLVHAHLRALGNKPPFDRATDLALVQSLGRGEKPHEFAADLGLDTKAVVDRFAALSASQRDRDNRLPIGAMAVLAQVLQWLTEQA